ncbi:HORMA domain-containing protein [Ditylenchus destructor]|uniref:HORMA domain-containing protein n=1 Tax=Ditylenchus destructor TaxID=166010 RepID=A0AAD4N5E5_9BILA|nr:HORMA domain-containing protein [Ditylenchus destructor]
MVIRESISELNEKRWTAVLPSNVEKEHDCLLFLSRMTYIAFAEYLFNRKIIPGGVFNKRRITDGDAREAIIMIGHNEEDPDSASEVFGVSYAYDEADCLKITDDQGKVLVSLGYKDKATLRKQVAFMVRKIAITAANLKPFDGKLFPSIKLSYYDERTPHDYQPSYFKHCDKTYYFDRVPQAFEFGTVSTDHTAMLFDIKSYYIGDVSALQESITNGESVAVADMNTTLELEVSRMDMSPQISPSIDYRAKESLTESSAGNDTTHEDYLSPSLAKKQQSLSVKSKKSGTKDAKKSSVKKRTVTPRTKVARRCIDMTALEEGTPVGGSPVFQNDTLSTADTHRMRSQAFKASVTTRRIEMSPDDANAYS